MKKLIVMMVVVIISLAIGSGLVFSQQEQEKSGKSYGNSTIPKDLQEKENELDTQINNLYDMYSYFYKVFYLTKDKQERPIKDKVKWIPYKMNLMWKCPPKNTISETYIDPRDFGLQRREDGVDCIMAEVHEYDDDSEGIAGMKKKLIMLYYTQNAKLDMVVMDVFSKSFRFDESTKYFRIVDDIAKNGANRNKTLIIPIIDNPFRYTKPEPGKEVDPKAKIQLYILHKYKERYLEDVRLRAEAPLRNDFKMDFYIPFLQYFYSRLNRVAELYNYWEKEEDLKYIDFTKGVNSF
jgi:hypothetical protein